MPEYKLIGTRVYRDEPKAERFTAYQKSETPLEAMSKVRAFLYEHGFHNILFTIVMVRTGPDDVHDMKVIPMLEALGLE